MRVAKAPSPVTPLKCATSFGPILNGLAGRLGAGWYLETTRACDGTDILLVMAAAEELDITITVTEAATGFVIDELRADRLVRLGECQTLDQVCSLVSRHIFQVPNRLGFAFSVHATAA